MAKKKSNWQNIFKYLSKQYYTESIRGRINWLVFASMTLLVVITGFTIYQNYHTGQVNEDIKRLRAPLSIESASIRSGLNRILFLQSLHIDNQDPIYIEKQDSVWQKQINPSFENITSIRTTLYDPQYTSFLDSLSALLPRFKVSQQITRQLIQALAELPRPKVRDSLAFNIYLRERFLLQQEIHASVAKHQMPIYNRLRDMMSQIYIQESATLKNDLAAVEKAIFNTNLTTTALLVLTCIFLLSLSYATIRRLDRSIRQPVEALNRLAQGELTGHITPSQDEFSAIIKASNRLQDNLTQASQFSLEIGEGNFNSAFSPLSESDILGNALLQMRDQLHQVAQEDQKRDWATQGLAKFSEILRLHNDDFKDFGDKVISNLVRYLGANQGGIFIAYPEQQGTSLELVACYAYDRKKFLQKKVWVGDQYAEGLLGQAYLEKETLHMTEMPEEHVQIVSGLGDGSPRSLLIVPLKLNEQVEGVLELASFQDFKPHEIAFVEKLAENIASSIIAVKTNNRTRELLAASQHQAEELRSQEEEMRQNNEELAATQEEMRRNSLELEKLLEESRVKEQEKARALEEAREKTEEMKQKQEELEKVKRRLESNEQVLKKAFDKAKTNEILLKEKNEEVAKNEAELHKKMDQLKAIQDKLSSSEQRLFKVLESIPAGVFVLQANGEPYFANQQAQEILGQGIVSIELGKNKRAEIYRAKIAGTDQPYPQDQMPLIRALQGEKAHIDDMDIDRNDRRVTLEVTANPIRDEQGQIEYAVAIFRDITERKKRNDELKKQQALFANGRDAVWILDEDKIVDCNKASLELFKCENPEKMIGKSIQDFSPELQPSGRTSEDMMQMHLQKCHKKGSNFYEWTHQNTGGREFECEILLSTIPYGEQTLIAAVIRDITERKMQETELIRRNQELIHKVRDFTTSQSEMKRGQQELFLNNEKLEANIQVLKKAFLRKKEAEQLLKQEIQALQERLGKV